MIYFYYLMAISLAIYFMTIFFFIVGLFVKSKSSSLVNKVSGVSIIICAKNSENSVISLINDLKSQNIEIDHEFIIVDDNSTDKTKESILNNIKGYPENPVEIEDVINKFYDCIVFSGKKLGKNKTDDLVNLILNLEKIKDIRNISNLYK